MRLFPSSGGIDFGVGAVKEALWKSGTCDGWQTGLSTV